jgi:hypothetical protein
MTLSRRWIFYISTMVAIISVGALLATKESRATTLLQRRLKAVSNETGNDALHIENPDHVPDLQFFVRVILLRPLRLLMTEPIVFLVSAISGTAFALIYLFTEALGIIYGYYGFSDDQASLAFTPIGIGFLCSIFTRIYDHHVAARFAKRNRIMLPEDKLTGFAIAAPAFAIGLWWFAWSIPPMVSVPWIVSMLVLVPVGFATNEFDCVLVGYLTDSYTTYASSAFASLSMLRSLLSAGFPLFAHSMYTNIAPNYAMMVLASFAAAVCVSPFVLIKYGERIRESSKFARYSVALGAGAANSNLDDKSLHAVTNATPLVDAEVEM